MGVGPYASRYSAEQMLALGTDPNRLKLSSPTVLGGAPSQSIAPADEARVRQWSASGGREGGRTTTSQTASNSPWPKGDIYDFLQSWYSSADPHQGIGALDAALREQGFEGYGGRWDVGGGVLSDNELSINGEKWKVLGNEHGADPFWYIPGTEDGGGGQNLNVSGEGVLGGDLYLSAARAAMRQRGRATHSGRQATILGGWKASANAAPTTRPTVLGGVAA